MSDMPCFLDCEASSLNSDSYPIEIAWSDEQGNIRSHLINPYAYPKNYTDWEVDAQAIHGLSRNYLSKNGELSETVANQLNQALAGKTVYSDGHDFDEFWCDRLFNAVNLKRSFMFKNMDELLEELLPIEYWHPLATSCGLNLRALKKRAREECGLDPHRAANDVAYLIKLYQIACEFS